MSMEFGIKNEKITKALLKTTIRKALRDIQTDPKRSVRNLVDLGLNFAEGCNQREIFDITQHYLSDENSAYFTLAENMVNEIDHEKLVTFGLNFGYNGCTSGARILREKQTELGCHLPFLITFTITDQPDSLSLAEIESAICQGMELGIFIYAVICKSDIYPELLETASRFSDCAFIFFVNPRRLTREVISRTSEIDNLVTSVRYDGVSDDCLESVGALRAQGCITVAHYEYTSASLDAILDNSLTEAFAETGAIAGILYSEPGADPDVQRKAAEYRAEIGRLQQYPVFIFEAQSDIKRIDAMFSGAECRVHFIGGGKVLYTAEQKIFEGANLREDTLADIFKRLDF